MRFPHHTRMSVTRRGDKELRLGAFIARGLDGIAALAKEAALPPARCAMLVIARSGQSPVVKTIANVASEIAATGCSVRIILVKPDRFGMPDALSATQAAGLDCELRSARNPRLIEAHEQLTIGARTSWTGDTMRRDPSICDAYESFVEDCPEIAVAAAATFERLWADCERLADGAALAADVPTRRPKQILPASLPVRRT